MTDQSSNGLSNQGGDGAQSGGFSPGSGEPLPSDRPPFLVAAVSAAPGEEFLQLLGAIPAAAPLALVLVQPLSGDHDGSLSETLAPRTALKVVAAQDHTPIEVGHAYIVPADAYMTVNDGHLTSRPRPPGAVSVQVDLLFRSLGECYREKSVGVLLTSGAADGVAGLREIKAAGGFTIAQRPDGAETDGHAKAGSAAAGADALLPAQEIAAELLRLAAFPSLVEPAREDGTSEEDLYAEIFRILRRGTGVDFSHYKRPPWRAGSRAAWRWSACSRCSITSPCSKTTRWRSNNSRKTC